MKLKEVGQRALVVVQRGSVLLSATVGTAMAQGATYDTASVTTQITAAVTAILAIGAAVTAGPKIAIRVWKWIGRAL